MATNYERNYDPRKLANKMSFKGKEAFLQFLEENLEYNPASNDMIYKDDLYAALAAYCIKNHLQIASPVCIGWIFRGAGIQVKRYGAAFHQCYCYVGFKWKIPDFETMKPAKRGRKEVAVTKRETKRASKRESKRKSKRKAKQITVEETEEIIVVTSETEEIIEVTSETEEDPLSLCTGDAAPDALQWNDQGLKLVKRTLEERMEESNLIAIMKEGKHGGGIRYKGKDAVMQFLEENLEYNPASNDMIYKDDLYAALAAYCIKNHLQMASPVCIGQHLRGAGVQVKRYGAAFHQCYCYVGFKWKIPDFKTMKPAKRGRKEVDIPKRRAKQVTVEETEVIIEVTSDNAKYFLSMCTGDIAQYALHWSGQKLKLVKRTLADRMKELKHLMAINKPGWWNDLNASST